jgi:hypothetical protein
MMKLVTINTASGSFVEVVLMALRAHFSPSPRAILVQQIKDLRRRLDLLFAWTTADDNFIFRCEFGGVLRHGLKYKKECWGAKECCVGSEEYSEGRDTDVTE